jgi:hypothetical protein
VTGSVPGRPAQTQIDALAVQRYQGAELLGDHQRRVIGQHHATRADAYRTGTARHVRDDHRGGRTGDARHVVMLGQPEAPVTQRFGLARQIERIAQRIRRARAFDDR